MIQAVRPVCATPIRSNTSFGVNPEAGQPQKRQGKSAAVAKYIGGQFVAGAMVSGIFDGVANLFNVVRKRPENIRPLPVIGSNALLMGAAFAVIGAVFAGIDMVRSKNK